MLRNALLFTAVGLVVTSTTFGAQAHIALTYPVSRDPSGTYQTTPPCGGQSATAAPTAFAAGAQVTLQWTNQIPHPGSYRVSVAADPNDFTSSIIAPDIPSPDHLGDMNYTVTLPTTPCAHCVLQLVQVNTSGTNSSTFSKFVEYVGCADITITAAAGTTGSTGGTTAAGTTTGGSSAAGGTGSASGGSTAASPQDNQPTGGCGAMRADTFRLLGAVLLLLRLERRRRRGAWVPLRAKPLPVLATHVEPRRARH